jgi:hypothetical protein
MLQAVPVLGCLAGQGRSALWADAVAGKVQVDQLPARSMRNGGTKCESLVCFLIMQHECEGHATAIRKCG